MASQSQPQRKMVVCSCGIPLFSVRAAASSVDGTPRFSCPLCSGGCLTDELFDTSLLFCNACCVVFDKGCVHGLGSLDDTDELAHHYNAALMTGFSINAGPSYSGMLVFENKAKAQEFVNDITEGIVTPTFQIPKFQ